MGKNRTIPFGYMMENGCITTNPAEVLAVLTIFSEYMAGKSLNVIAKDMAVPYSDGSNWNKNMVKRILENEKYLGNEDYPQLVSEEVFKAVNSRKTIKATALCIVPEDMQAVRSLTVCKECGKKLFRTKTNAWDCKNQECKTFEFRLTDIMLTSAIINVMNTVIANPGMIEQNETVSEYSATSEIMCGQSIIDRNIYNCLESEENVRNDILRLAEQKYNSCTYSDVMQKTEILKSILSESAKIENLDNGLLKSCVKRITVSHSYVIEVEFINSVVIKIETGRNGINVNRT